jgi:type IV pilus assembly protein PilE
MNKLSKGFTLIELMIVVAVIGILAAIAYPSYKEQIDKSRRANAKSVLLDAQAYMERVYSENYAYDKDTSGVLINSATYFQSNFTVAPKPGDGNPAYTVSLSATTQQYTITAAPISPGVMANDKCGTYRVNRTGRKSVVGYDTTKFSTQLMANRDCWK